MSPKPLGFTRIELLAVTAALGLLSLVVAPALANGKHDGERAVCWNNLRTISRAIQTWSNDHDDQPPWWTLIRDGGTLPPGNVPKPSAAWFEYAFLSNYVGSPKVLACPADYMVRPASNWFEFTLASGRGKSLSYTLGLHSMADAPRAWVGSDLNLAADGASAGNCTSAATKPDQIIVTNTSLLAWTNGLAHGDRGHLLLGDGTAEFISTARLRELVFAPEANRIDQGTNHFERAR